MAQSAHRRRYRRILAFASRVLVQVWWFELVLPRIGFEGTADRTREARMLRIARRFHGLAVDLGGLMIKVGQFLSSRLDVLPPEVTQELAGLQDEVPAVPFADIRALAEAELGTTLALAYERFDETPVAAASLGQVHRARLSPAAAADAGFADVVVKVQRPGIDAIIDTDLAALRKVGGWLRRIRIVRERVDAPALVEEFARTSLEEVDYLHEAASGERFASDFEDDVRVAAPAVAWERTTRRVLTLADVTAIKINDIDALRAAGIDPSEVARVFADVMFEQVFTHGFFHADPHPGNIFVTPLGIGASAAPVSTVVGAGAGAGGGDPQRVGPELSGADPLGAPVSTVAGVAGEHPQRVGPEQVGDQPAWRLTFVDFGMMGEVPAGIRDGLRALLIAVAARDGKKLVAAAQDMGVLLPSAQNAELERALTTLFSRFGGMGFAELRDVDPHELQDFAMEFGEVVRTMPFQLPEGLLMLFRAVSLTSGMCSGLDPAFNVWDAVEPYAKRLLREESGNVVQDFAKQTLENAAVLWRMPGRIDSAITRLEQGSLTFDLSRLERRMGRLELLVRRAVGAVLFAGLLIGGVLLLPTSPAWGGVLMGVSAVPLLYALAAGLFTSKSR
ncbi:MULTISPECIES: AarF/ABC1/UbiB kinase family protein [unclassified Microbacterium]|uniref:ABC1 kinase family protein n=1 Tax=unclassified Microbacterium TaxID=2609290 RepID=UPI001E2D7C0B|nr:AarF/UbiB family protein [Microbacterium sp. MAH-37]